MNKEDHPKGLNSDDRKQWHDLCEKLFQLYERMEPETKRKIIAGSNHENRSSMMILFTGTQEEVYKVADFLKKLD
jgi:hypothetical protein